MPSVSRDTLIDELRARRAFCLTGEDVMPRRFLKHFSLPGGFSQLNMLFRYPGVYLDLVGPQDGQ